ncbi:MAG: hypothetical protein ACTSWP_06525 [Candidatus Freyarchaeota archaeon]|nr:hypothetical protein [Candidatus Freyrarchaeum guaymaensis]
MIDKIRGSRGYRQLTEKAERALRKAFEEEARGRLRESIEKLREAVDAYSSLGEKGKVVEVDFFRAHCSAFQASRERTVEGFRSRIEEAIKILGEVRRLYIKENLSIGRVERDVRIGCCVAFINALRTRLEENVAEKKKIFSRAIDELSKCLERLEKIGDYEKCGILSFWSGEVKLECAPYFEGEEKVNVLLEAAKDFGDAEKFLREAGREKQYLCLEARGERCEVEAALEKRDYDGIISLRAEAAGVYPREDLCGWIHRYNLALLELEILSRENVYGERLSRLNKLLKDSKEVAERLEREEQYDVASEAYLLLGVVGYKMVKLLLTEKARRTILRECYEALKKAYRYARRQVRNDLTVRSLILIPKVVSEYSEVAESDVLKANLVREGAAYGREALNEVKRFPEGNPIVGELYSSMVSYLIAAARVEQEPGRSRELLGNAIRYGEAALEYAKEEEKWADHLYDLAKAYYILSLRGKGEALEKAKSAIKKAREAYIAVDDLVGGVRSAVLSGDIYREAWMRSGDERDYLRAKQSYLEGGRMCSNFDWSEMEGEVLIRLAELEDLKGEYSQSVEYYLQALEKLRRAREERDYAKERARYVEAMANIERGKEKVKVSTSEAASFYRRGAELLPRGYEYEAKFYRALSELLEAEAVSLVDHDKALSLLKSASKKFKEVKQTGRRIGSELERRADVFIKLCEGKTLIEEGLTLHAKGEHSPALVKFSMAIELLRDISGQGEKAEWESIEGYLHFAQGLEKFERGHIGSRDELLEAAELFRVSSEEFVTNKMKNAMLGFFDLCYGWHRILEYIEVDEEAMDVYVTARTHFGRSANFFMDAGLENYTRYAEGMEFLLDGERYARMASMEKLDEARRRYYKLAYESYVKAMEKFSEAGQVALERMVSDKARKLREEEIRQEYLEILGGGRGETTLLGDEIEALRDGFLIVRVREPADRSFFTVGERIKVSLEIRNIGDKPVILEKIKGVVPPGFKVIGKEREMIKDGEVEFNEEVDAWQKIDLEIKMIGERGQDVKYQPLVIFRDGRNRKRFFKPSPVSLLISGGE